MIPLVPLFGNVALDALLKMRVTVIIFCLIILDL